MVHLFYQRWEIKKDYSKRKLKNNESTAILFLLSPHGRYVTVLSEA